MAIGYLLVSIGSVFYIRNRACIISFNENSTHIQKFLSSSSLIRSFHWWSLLHAWILIWYQSWTKIQSLQFRRYPLKFLVQSLLFFSPYSSGSSSNQVVHSLLDSCTSFFALDLDFFAVIGKLNFSI